MRKNVGSMDRAIRIVVGVLLMSLILVGPQTVWGWVGLLPLVTGFIGRCPIYRLFKVQSCLWFGVDTCYYTP
ncbi:MAG: DUF2892 domain-containing protein [Magnetococcales bacterium]|nr:DUF2892 domain-containing protein [Magnetococcales bacterium]